MKIARENDLVNFRGAKVEVTPLHEGPSLVFAEIVPLSEVTKDTRGSACPDEATQIVRVVWNGGASESGGTWRF